MRDNYRGDQPIGDRRRGARRRRIKNNRAHIQEESYGLPPDSTVYDYDSVLEEIATLGTVIIAKFPKVRYPYMLETGLADFVGSVKYSEIDSYLKDEALNEVGNFARVLRRAVTGEGIFKGNKEFYGGLLQTDFDVNDEEGGKLVRVGTRDQYQDDESGNILKPSISIKISDIDTRNRWFGATCARLRVNWGYTENMPIISLASGDLVRRDDVSSMKEFGPISQAAEKLAKLKPEETSPIPHLYLARIDILKGQITAFNDDIREYRTVLALAS